MSVYSSFITALTFPLSPQKQGFILQPLDPAMTSSDNLAAIPISHLMDHRSKLHELDDKRRNKK